MDFYLYGMNYNNGLLTVWICVRNIFNINDNRNIYSIKFNYFKWTNKVVEAHSCLSGLHSLGQL